MQLVEHRFQSGVNISQVSSRRHSSMYLQDGANELNELYGQDLRAIAPVLGTWGQCSSDVWWCFGLDQLGLTWDQPGTDWKCRGIGAQLLRSRCLGDDAELTVMTWWWDSDESHKLCQGMGWHPGVGVGANLDGESDSQRLSMKCQGHTRYI